MLIFDEVADQRGQWKKFGAAVKRAREFQQSALIFQKS